MHLIWLMRRINGFDGLGKPDLGFDVALSGAESRSCRHRSQQSSHSDEVVSGVAEGKHPPHACQSSMPQLAQQTDRLAPTKALLNELTFPLTHSVALVPRRARINGAAPVAVVLGHLRRDVARAHFANEVLRVISFVGRQRTPL